MRVLSGLMLVGVAFGAAPSAAHAQTPLCTPNPGVVTESRLARLIDPATVVAKEVLGAQYVLPFFNAQRHAYGLAFSAGALDAESAQAAFEQAIAARVSAEDAAYLKDRVYFAPTAYSTSQLEDVFSQIDARKRSSEAPYVTSYGWGCTDAVRIHVGVGLPDTPENRATVEAFLAPYGDLVRVEYGINPFPANEGPPSSPGIAEQSGPGQRPTLKVRDYVTLPRTSRCARTVGAKVRSGADVKRVRLAIGKRVSAGKHPRLKLKSKRSKVTVTVTLRDGTTAIEKLTYRRCA